MSCRALVVAVVTAACTVDEVPVLEVPATATEQTSLAPPTPEPIPDTDGEYRWELVLAPATSQAVDPVGAAVATFTPDLRGTYLVERWLTYGLAEALTHRFVVVADGTPPTAVARSGATVDIGTAVALDGSESSSAEGLPLTFRWRLIDRPRDSSATVADPAAATTTLVPDRAGEYTVELLVFDGELWSPRASLLLIQAR